MLMKTGLQQVVAEGWYVIYIPHKYLNRVILKTWKVILTAYD